MSYQLCDRLYWPGGRTKAFTMSYDDGIEQDIRLLKIMNQYNIRGTFNINSGLLGRKNYFSPMEHPDEKTNHFKITADQLRKIYKGQEIAAHGRFHSLLNGMDSARISGELLLCRSELENIIKRPVVGYAYAFGAFDDTIHSCIESCGFLYGRTIASTHTFDLPQNLLKWDPTCHHDDPELFDLANSFLSNAPYFSFISPAKLFYLCGHSYEFDQHNNWELINQFLSTISGHEDIWYATNIEIASYLKAYRSLVFSVDSNIVYNPTCQSVWIGEMFHPVSIEVAPGAMVKLLPPVEM